MLAMGEPISSKQALEIASSYLVKSGAPRRAAAQMSVQPFQTDRQGNPLMYAVNNGGEGYAIVSGDDRMRQVLLYSNSGSLDLADMPANMRYWLQTLCADMQILIDAGYQPQAVESRRAAAEVKTEIRTMLPSHWGQDTPYNALCPKDGKSLSLTGCVATAMAQVIYYHYKVRKAAIPSQPLKDTKAYKGYRGIEVKALKAEDYIIDWSQLIDDYTAKGVTPTEAQKQNIAKLMYFCGAAVEMDYNSSVSLASDNMLSPALINYFGFSPATRLVNRASYTEQQWDDLIYKELKNGRPVLYGGSGSAGHQFVIDGYNGNELFHVNWGWNGSYDNYVALSVLNSSQSFPIGARESTAEFAGGQGAVINAEYGGTAKAADRLSFFSSSVSENEMTFNLYNRTGITKNFDVCLAYKNLKTGDTGYLDSEKKTWKDVVDGESRPYTYKLTTPDTKAANTTVKYYPVSRVEGTTEWLTVSDPVLEYALATYDAEGKVTITLYPTDKLETTIEVEGNKYVGNTQKVKAAIKNTGDEKQLTIYFWIKDDEDYFKKTDVGNLKYEYAAGITALKNATHVEVTNFTPKKEGTYYVLITRDDRGREELATSQITIAANPHKVNGLAFMEFNPKGLQSTIIKENGDIVQEVYAPTITPKTFRLVNASSADIKEAKVTFNVFQKSGETWKQLEGSSLGGSVSLEPDENLGVNGWSFVDGVGEYRLELVCDNVVTDTRFINTHESYTVVDANGRQTPTLYSSGSIATPANATAMMMEYFVNNNVAVTPNDNPNTLYYLSEGMTATGLDNKNVINYDQAANIALQDGYDFNVPYDFTAKSISYKRTFEAGWTTLMVPFEVATIPEGLTAYEFVSEDGSEVTFKKLNKLSAFEACLVKVDATKEYIFKATNQKLFANYLDAATALNFKFVGITTKPAYEQVYMLNADGTKFEKNTNPAYKSFRGCFVPTYGATNLPDALTVKGTPTGIKTIQATDAKTDDAYYNLSGQRVSADFNGIVIHHGKKILKK